MHLGTVLLRNVAIVHPVGSGFGILTAAPTVIPDRSGVRTWTIAKKAAATGSGERYYYAHGGSREVQYTYEPRLRAAAGTPRIFPQDWSSAWCFMT